MDGLIDSPACQLASDRPIGEPLKLASCMQSFRAWICHACDACARPNGDVVFVSETCTFDLDSPWPSPAELAGAAGMAGTDGNRKGTPRGLRSGEGRWLAGIDR